ncbi:astacin-like metalloendopeptidase [Sceloporus undulatus]|uniref:astacin-like metalloendopeptidase n=1 Tax=Sceloporus undulatus TaxID=8520 RepID=UPI001C4C9392|nr:astacin-like metalloendopeptidase [Sceloporus undulatus]
MTPLQDFPNFLACNLFHPSSCVMVDEPDDEMETAFDLILKANKGNRQKLMEGDIAVKFSRSAIFCAANPCYWPQSSDGIVRIPYAISSDFEQWHRDLIQEAMTEFETLTCINFVERKEENDYLNIVPGYGCSSFPGKIGGAQTIFLSKTHCMWKGVVEHELEHALGLIHEHSRSDRDKYVKIMWQYISPNHRKNFELNPNSNNLGLEYDYASIMHYGRRTLSNTSGEATIIPIPDDSIRIGQFSGISNLDVAKINRLHNCSRCSSVLVASNGSLTSANYPSKYPNGVNCLWLIRIQGPSYRKVQLKFEVFDLQSSKDCTADYVKVYDGISKSDKMLLDKTCGAKVPPSVISSKSTMLVEFVSDHRIAGIGFKASYTTGISEHQNILIKQSPFRSR